MAGREGLGYLDVADGQTVCVDVLQQVGNQVVMRHVGAQHVHLLMVEGRLLNPNVLLDVSIFIKELGLGLLEVELVAGLADVRQGDDEGVIVQVGMDGLTIAFCLFQLRQHPFAGPHEGDAHGQIGRAHV